MSNTVFLFGVSLICKTIDGNLPVGVMVAIIVVGLVADVIGRGSRILLNLKLF